MDKKVCENHSNGTQVIFDAEGRCPLCVLGERFDRLEKQYEQMRDEVEMTRAR